MPNAELAFADEHLRIAVRAFAISDGVSQLFEVNVTGGSPSPDLDLGAIVGRPAALRLHTGDPAHPYAVWSGLCCDAEQIAVEEQGLSLYALRIVPMLWRATQRRNMRIFQHASAVDIAALLLGEWGIEPVLRLERDRFPRHEYRVQYGETDFSFVSRMLEEAGISYAFEQQSARGAEKGDREDALPSMALVLTDRPGHTARWRKAPITYLGTTAELPRLPWISNVRVGRAVRAGRFSIAGYDYRSSAELRLLSEAHSGVRLEERYEMFHYAPEAFIAEPGAAAEEGARPRSAHLDDKVAQAAAQIGLERERTRQQRIAFDTNQLDLAPGTVLRLEGHPRAELCSEAGLLVVARRIEGQVHDVWRIANEAVIATDPYRPALTAPKPRVMGVESAIVVGPRGEEIYTDELGRVRVQFHWDRYGKRDEGSSCWIRVSQGWAGSGYGTSHVPRVGHEVLVDFFEGDPDQPVIVGRAYSRGALPPDELPKKKTKSTWRSASSPGRDGFSEISIDDAQGEELVYLRAQRNLKKMVVLDEEAAVGGSLKTSVRKDETRTVTGKQTIVVKGDRVVDVDGTYSTRAQNGLLSRAGDTGVSVSDGRIVLSNGSASIVLDGPHVYIDAEANVRLSAGRMAGIYGGQISLDARPDIFINGGEYVPPEVARLPGAERGRGRGRVDRGRGRPDAERPRPDRPRRPGGMDEAEFSGKDYLVGVVNRSLGTHVRLPKSLHLPREMDEQLERYGCLGFRGERVGGALLDADTYRDMKGRFDNHLEREKNRLQRLGNDVHRTFEKHRDHYDKAAEQLGARLAEERGHLAKAGDDIGAVFRGEKGNLLQSAKALGHAVQEQAKHLQALRNDIKSMVDRELAYFEQVKHEWQGVYKEVKGYAEEVKHLVDNPKDALLQMALGKDKQMARDVADIADQFGAGDEVRDFFGVQDPPGRGGADGPARPPPHEHPPHHRPPHERPPERPRGREFRRSPRQRFGQSHGQGHGQGQGKAELRRGRSGRPLENVHGEARPRRGRGTERIGSRYGDMHERSGTLGPGVSGHAGGSQAPIAKVDGYGGDALCRRGGLGAGDFANTVRADGPSFLQSPGDGQIMVVPEQGARALDAARLKAAMVDAQMAGKPVNDAVAHSLSQQGYTVYSRPWGDWVGPFVQTAEATAKA